MLKWFHFPVIFSHTDPLSYVSTIENNKSVLTADNFHVIDTPEITKLAITKEKCNMLFFLSLHSANQIFISVNVLWDVEMSLFSELLMIKHVHFPCHMKSMFIDFCSSSICECLSGTNELFLFMLKADFLVPPHTLSLKINDFQMFEFSCSTMKSLHLMLAIPFCFFFKKKTNHK